MHRTSLEQREPAVELASYKIHELPSTTEPLFLRCSMEVQGMRHVVTDFTLHILGQSAPFTVPTRVTFAILDRIAEGALSVELLCLKNRLRDAAILLLSLYELALDAQFMARDITRCTTWIEHVKEQKKPWSVASQQREIFSDPGELDAEKKTIAGFQWSNIATQRAAFSVFRWP